MVLSTSRNDVVTSIMMSIIVLIEKLYFQTDKTLRKYSQLKENPNVFPCIDNIQIEGHSEEIGSPLEHLEFINTYEKYFPSSYARYTAFDDKCLFAVIQLLSNVGCI